MQLQMATSQGGQLANQNREMARIQGEIFMAKQYPRDMERALKLIESDCSNANLADKAVYRYARGGTEITGPSIRLAEVLARRMGNIRYGFEEVEQNEYRTVVRCYCFDIEANTQAERTFVVPHMRHTRKGDYELTDPRDIYEAVANQAQRRVRACILEVIPGDIVDIAVNLCTETIEKKIHLDQNTKNKIVESFGQYGVTKKMIEARIQRNMDAITAQHVVQLRQILKSIHDGIGKVENYFDFSIEEDPEPAETPKKKSKAKAKEPTDEEIAKDIPPAPEHEPTEEEIDAELAEMEDIF